MVYTSFNRRVMNEDVENVFDILSDVDTSGVSDNIEEATSNLLYETEVNWNSLMQAVGIAELTAMESTGEVIYEAVDFKAFFGKVKEFFKGLLEKIGKLFKKIVEKAKELFGNIKKFFAGNKKNGTSNTNNSTTDYTKYGPTYDKSKLALTSKQYKDITYDGYVFTNLDNYGPSFSNVYGNIDFLNKYNDFYTDFLHLPTFNPKRIELYEKMKALEAEYSSKAKKDEILHQIRTSFISNINLSGDYDWNKELFKYFRNSKSEPEKITMKDSDISEYQNIIKNNEKLIEDVISKSYKRINDTVNEEISSCESFKSKMNNSDNNDYLDDVVIRYKNAEISCYKLALQEAVSIITAQSNAIMAQTRQYKAAITRIMQASDSSVSNKQVQPDEINDKYGSFDNFMRDKDATLSFE